MTTEETIRYIRLHIDADDYTLKYMDKYSKGYARGLICMASLQMIITPKQAEMLEQELDEAEKQGKLIKLAKENVDV